MRVELSIGPHPQARFATCGKLFVLRALPLGVVAPHLLLTDERRITGRPCPGSSSANSSFRACLPARGGGQAGRQAGEARNLSSDVRSRLVGRGLVHRTLLCRCGQKLQAFLADFQHHARVAIGDLAHFVFRSGAQHLGHFGRCQFMFFA